MLTAINILLIQTVAMGTTVIAQERAFGNNGFFEFTSTTTEGPIYQPIPGLGPNQHGYTLIDPQYARQYAHVFKRPTTFDNSAPHREQGDDYHEANKKRTQTTQEFRPSQPLPPAPPTNQHDYRFSSENPNPQNQFGSEKFLRGPPPSPPPPPKIPFNFEQHPSVSLKRPPPMATPPPPPPSLKNFPSIPFQPTTNPPLVIPELPNQDFPENPLSLFANENDNNNNNFQVVDFQRTGAPQQTTPRRPPVVVRQRVHRPPPTHQTLTSTRGPTKFQSDEYDDDSFEITAPIQQHKRVQIIKKPVIPVDTATKTINTDQAEFNEEVAKEQASRAQYDFQSSVQDTVNGQEQIRQETRDGLRLKGLYSYSDGFFKRTVYYVADENGYRVIKEESEPIGSGPQYDPDGQVNVETSFGGTGHRYSISGQQLEAAKKRKS